MTESRRRRYSASLKSKVALASLREEASTAELAQIYGVHASQVSSWKRRSSEVVCAYFEGKVRSCAAAAAGFGAAGQDR